MNKLSFTEIEADANATAARVCISIWGNNYDKKISPYLFNKIKEEIREKLS